MMSRDQGRMGNVPRRAVFFDKDGTLVKDRPYNVDPRRIEFERGAEAAVSLLARAGYRLVIVSNQSGVAQGLFAEHELLAVESYVRRAFQASGAALSGFYYCPHHPDAALERYAIACDCRKPGPGLIEKAARDLNIDRSGSWMVGDILHDIEAGNRAGCKTILIHNGNETEWDFAPERVPDFLAADLLDAADYILEHSFDEGRRYAMEGSQENSLRAP